MNSEVNPGPVKSLDTTGGVVHSYSAALRETEPKTQINHARILTQTFFFFLRFGFKKMQ